MSRERKYKITFILICTALVATASWFTWNKFSNIQEVDESSISYVSPQNEWKTYENKKYGYQISYPPQGLVTKIQEMDPASIETSEAINIFIPGEKTNVILTGGTHLSIYLKSVDAEAFKKLLKTDTESFAKTVWKDIKNDTNQYIEKEVSMLEQRSFASTGAYTFSVKERGSYYAKQDAERKGLPYVPWSNMYTFLIFENGNSEKIIIQYNAGGQTSEQIINTFKFAN